MWWFHLVYLEHGYPITYHNGQFLDLAWYPSIFSGQTKQLLHVGMIKQSMTQTAKWSKQINGNQF